MRRASLLKFPVLGAIPLAALAATTGCSINTYGLTATRISQANGALVADVYALGVNLRTRSDDSGLAVGASKRSYIYPAAGNESVSAGWHYFGAALPKRRALAQDLRNFGLDISSGRSGIGVDLGLSQTTILARTDGDAAFTMRLTYRPTSANLNSLTYCEGESAC